MNLIHYIIVRKDLPLGIMAAMITHAAGESASHRLWPLPPHTTAVVLEALNEDHLKDIVGYLRINGIDFTQVIESDHPYEGQLMSLGLKPADRARFGNKLKGFNLLKSCAPQPKPVDNEDDGA